MFLFLVLFCRAVLHSKIIIKKNVSGSRISRLGSKTSAWESSRKSNKCGNKKSENIGEMNYEIRKSWIFQYLFIVFQKLITPNIWSTSSFVKDPWRKFEKMEQGQKGHCQPLSELLSCCPVSRRKTFLPISRDKKNTSRDGEKIPLNNDKEARKTFVPWEANSEKDQLKKRVSIFGLDWPPPIRNILNIKKRQ